MAKIESRIERLEAKTGVRNKRWLVLPDPTTGEPTEIPGCTSFKQLIEMAAQHGGTGQETDENVPK